MTISGTRSLPYLLLAAVVGCGQSAPKAATKPATAAKVEKLPGEADLTTVTVTEEAVGRLGIATAAVERKAVPRVRALGGELVIPPGRTILVSSPLAGTLLTPKAGMPTPGSAVKKGREVFRIRPLLSPEALFTMNNSRVDAQGQVDQAEKQLAQAQILLNRAEQLQKDKIGGAGATVDARSSYDVAAAALHAATARRDALDKTIKGLEGGTLDPISIVVEADGVLKNLHALAGQAVASGAPLFEVIRPESLWVRVPVYVGDLRTIAAKDAAEVTDLNARAGEPVRPAKPVVAPPSGDPLAATVDLFYAVDNADGALRPGQRVAIALPLEGEKDSLVVPKAAILRDFDGGAWVYVVLGPHKYSRKRVRLDRVIGPLAVLSAGPAVGTEVVTDGAAELFGTEFGGAK